MNHSKSKNKKENEIVILNELFNITFSPEDMHDPEKIKSLTVNEPTFFILKPKKHHNSKPKSS